MHESLLLNVGLSTPEGSYHNVGAAMIAQIKNEIIIYSFTIDLNFIGDLTIYFDNKTTGEIKRKTVNILSIGVQDIILNVELKPGRYYIGRDDALNTPLKRTPYNVLFPFTNNDITLIGSTTGEPKWYYYWFNIKYYRKKILHYDFQECGEPTTNLLSTDSLIFENSVGGWSLTRLSISISNEWHEIGHNSLKILNTNGDFSLATGYYAAYQIHNHMLNNIKYTMSMTVYNPNLYDLIIQTLNLGNGILDSNGDILIDKYKIKSRSKKRIWFTVMYSDAETIGYHLRLGIYEGQPIDSIFYIDAVQFEKKDHLTPFVIGSREGKILDKSGYNFHLTILELTSPIWQKSVINNYLYKFNNKELDGQTFQHFKTDLFIPKTFSFGLWIKGSILEQPLDNIYPFGWLNLCTMGPSGGTSDNRSGIIYYYDASNYTSWNPGSRNLYNGKWHHWFITYDGNTGLLKQYIDGQLDLETVKTDLYHLETVRPFNVGSLWAINYGGHGGNITDVRVYLTLLTDLEIKEIYNKTKKTKVEEKRNYINIVKKPVNNLVLYYKFDEFVESTENFCSDNNPYYGDIGNSVWIESEKLYGTKTTSDWYDLGHCYGTMTVLPGDYILISFELKIINSLIDHTLNIFGSDTDSAGMSIRTYSQNKRINLANGTIVENTKTLPADGNWYKFIWIYQIQTFSGLPSWRIEEYGDNSELNKYILHRKIQFEKKDHLTPFTPSIRNGYIKDYSGNNNYGRIYLGNSPKYIELEKLYEFNGNNYIKILNNQSLNLSNELTIMAWVNPYIFKDHGTILTKNQSYYFQVHLDGSIAVYTYWNNNGIIGSSLYTYSEQKIILNEWSHITYVENKDGQRFIYINGLLDKIDVAESGIWVNNYDVFIGMQDGITRPFNGKIKDVRIYNKLLSLNLIKQLYNQTKWS